MTANPRQKLQEKIRGCKQLIIQNMEKTIKPEMVWKYLVDSRVPQKSYHMKGDGVINIDFPDHEKALDFYRRANFKDKILIRPLNIYFKLELEDSEMKKYHFEGLKEENMRKFFQIVQQVGICKIYTNYGVGASGKLKSKGSVSFIRTDDIPEEKFKQLRLDLEDIGVRLDKYSPADAKLKCSIFVNNFYQGICLP